MWISYEKFFSVVEYLQKAHQQPLTAKTKLILYVKI